MEEWIEGEIVRDGSSPAIISHHSIRKFTFARSKNRNRRMMRKKVILTNCRKILWYFNSRRRRTQFAVSTSERSHELPLHHNFLCHIKRRYRKSIIFLMLPSKALYFPIFRTLSYLIHRVRFEWIGRRNFFPSISSHTNQLSSNRP